MILPILHHPNKRLRIVAKPVKTIDNSIKLLINNMLETMYDVSGIGLAATQVDTHKRVIVIDIPECTEKPLFLINPEIIEKSTEKILEYKEGCLSIPDYKENIARSKHIKITYLNEQGKKLELTAEGLLSICIQHEIDHLNGILFIDYLSKMKQKRLLDKIEKKMYDLT